MIKENSENDFLFEEKAIGLSLKILGKVFYQDKLNYLLFLSKKCSEEKIKISKNDYTKFSTKLKRARSEIEIASKTKTYRYFDSISNLEKSDLAYIASRLDFYLSKLPKIHSSGSCKNYQYYQLLNFLHIQIQKVKIKKLKILKTDLMIDGKMIINLRYPNSQNIELKEDRLLILLMRSNKTMISERDFQERIQTEFKRLNHIELNAIQEKAIADYKLYKKGILPSKKSI